MTIAVGATGMLTGFVTFLETIFPPETRNAQRAWAAIPAVVALTAIILVVVQVRLAAKEREKSDTRIAEDEYLQSGNDGKYEGVLRPSTDCDGKGDGLVQLLVDLLNIRPQGWPNCNPSR